jgi:hypothetical protein
VRSLARFVCLRTPQSTAPSTCNEPSIVCSRRIFVPTIGCFGRYRTELAGIVRTIDAAVACEFEAGRTASRHIKSAVTSDAPTIHSGEHTARLEASLLRRASRP